MGKRIPRWLRNVLIVEVSLLAFFCCILPGTGALFVLAMIVSAGPGDGGSDGPRSDWNALWAGDLDGDGHGDVLLSTPFDPEGAYGIVRAVSGRDGSVRWRMRAFHTRSIARAAPAGDLDGDGRADVLAHADATFPWRQLGLGSWTLEVSGLDGHEILRVADPWGYGFAATGDLNGDGVRDLLIPGSGSVRVVSGKDGATLYSCQGEADEASYGRRVGAIGDVDRDGAEDFAVGSGSSLQARSGRTGKELWRLEHARIPTGFAPIDDLDADGIPDLVVWDSGTGANGSLLFVSARNGSVLRRIDRGEGGGAVAPIGDVDGDGSPDLALEEGSAVVVLSSRDDRRLCEFPDRQLGEGRGDLDGDGCSDILLLKNWSPGSEPVSPGDARDNAWRWGRLEVISGRDRTLLLHVDGQGIAFDR